MEVSRNIGDLQELVEKEKEPDLKEHREKVLDLFKEGGKVLTGKSLTESKLQEYLGALFADVYPIESITREDIPDGYNEQKEKYAAIRREAGERLVGPTWFGTAELEGKKGGWKVWAILTPDGQKVDLRYSAPHKTWRGVG